jgi:non-heme chloroperoxidase
VAKLVLVGAVPPLMLKTDGDPAGLPRSVFDGIREWKFDNRSQFYKDLTIPFHGHNRDGAAVSEGIRESFWLRGMMGDLKGQLDCIREFSEVDYTADLQKVDIPTLIVHGDYNQIVPIGASALLLAKIVRNATLKVYQGAPHGLGQTHQDRLNGDLLAFINRRRWPCAHAGANAPPRAISGLPFASICRCSNAAMTADAFTKR